MTPSDENECRQMLYTGYHYGDGPSAVRYPRGTGTGATLEPLASLPIGKGVVKREGEKIAILNFGTLLKEAAQVADKLNATLVDMRFVKPLDNALILQLAAGHEALVTLEENAIMGGAGSGVNELLMAHRRAVPVLNIGSAGLLYSPGNPGRSSRRPRSRCRRYRSQNQRLAGLIPPR
ncbi:1-deoxy-D-xylulose-5-phosphate synthase [Raoultella terrigena]|uniref:1-deoxy-D-xylulose-5-phosphate synthase n=1 Tax=Raoultella terrigena TaxID=577 RepID=A0A4U9D7F7_RAOTE|nr:1-deoxy-D-xylulose-5-phosphate synthase [Raoultella terrigena]